MNITKDATWGWVLIVLGVALLLFAPGDKITRWIEGKGDRWITIGLVATMGIYGLIAWRASPEVKAIALAWAVTP